MSDVSHTKHADIDAPKSGEQLQFLSFSVNGEEYAVGIMRVREIRGWSETTSLPNSPKTMKGVINLRGFVIPIFDLRAHFSMGETTPNEKNVVIIIAVQVDEEERLVGVLVDSVSDIINTPESEIRQTPKLNASINNSSIQGLIQYNDRNVILLDVDTLFDSSTLQEAVKANTSKEPASSDSKKSKDIKITEDSSKGDNS